MKSPSTRECHFSASSVFRPFHPKPARTVGGVSIPVHAVVGTVLTSYPYKARTEHSGWLPDQAITSPSALRGDGTRKEKNTQNTNLRQTGTHLHQRLCRRPCPRGLLDLLRPVQYFPWKTTRRQQVKADQREMKKKRAGGRKHKTRLWHRSTTPKVQSCGEQTKNASVHNPLRGDFFTAKLLKHQERLVRPPFLLAPPPPG